MLACTQRIVTDRSSGFRRRLNRSNLGMRPCQRRDESREGARIGSTESQDATVILAFMACLSLAAVARRDAASAAAGGARSRAGERSVKTKRAPSQQLEAAAKARCRASQAQKQTRSSRTGPVSRHSVDCCTSLARLVHTASSEAARRRFRRLAVAFDHDPPNGAEPVVWSNRCLESVRSAYRPRLTQPHCDFRKI